MQLTVKIIIKKQEEKWKIKFNKYLCTISNLRHIREGKKRKVNEGYKAGREPEGGEIAQQK